MNAAEFVRRWKHEKEELLGSFLSPTSESAIPTMIDEMNLSPTQHEALRTILDTVLTDTMYTLLLGLDGSASIGGVQETFRIEGESGTVVSTCGELELEAWRQFHEATNEHL